jgi:hypothetical protein
VTNGTNGSEISATNLNGPDNPKFCTDYDATEIFNKLLHEKREV